MQPNNGFPNMGQQPSMPPATPVHNKRFNSLIIPLVIAILLLIGAIVFGLWAFGERSTYKNETDKIVATEVEKAKEELGNIKDLEFAEQEKSPNKEYRGPDAFGGVGVLYPKTWSAYVIENDKSSTSIDGYFHPGFVPGVQSGSAFALRLRVVDSDYAAELKKFDSGVKSGKVKVSAVNAAKVASTLGSRIDGEISTGKQGSLVLFPLRDKTLMISTESQQFIADFNSIILPNLSFAP